MTCTTHVCCSDWMLQVRVLCMETGPMLYCDSYYTCMLLSRLDARSVCVETEEDRVHMVLS